MSFEVGQRVTIVNTVVTTAKPIEAVITEVGRKWAHFEPLQWEAGWRFPCNRIDIATGRRSFYDAGPGLSEEWAVAH